MLTRREFTAGGAGALLLGSERAIAASFADANSSDIPSTISADICIVGAGAAGITLARQLARHRRSCLLIESGGAEFNATTQQLYEAAVVGLPYLPQQSRLRYFGGSTNHWSGWCRPVDVDSAAVPQWAWPISSSEMSAHFDLAHEFCQIGPTRWRASDWLSHISAPPDRKHKLSIVDDDHIASLVWQYSLPPVNFGASFRQDLLHSPYVRVLTNLNLVSATFLDDNVAGLHCQTLNGKRIMIAPKTVVLCCGGIENARILLTLNRDGDRQPGNDRDLVGRYFVDHVIPHTIADVIPTSGDFSYYADQWTTTVQTQSNKTPIMVRALFSLTGAEAQELNVPQIVARLEPPTAVEPGDTALVQFARSAAQEDLGPYKGAVPWTATRIPLVMLFTHLPEWSSRVLLSSRDIDPFGTPRAVLDWQLNNMDIETIRKFTVRLGATLAAKKIGRVWWRLPQGSNLSDLVRAGSWIGNHHMCTTRMSNEPANGVVDSNLRVFGTTNLYVCGSSVFPHASAATPTLTIVALAARLAAHLARGT